MTQKILKTYKCLGPTITIEKIEALQKTLRKNKVLREKLHEFFLLSLETRLYLLYLLTLEEELCVCDMADILGVEVSALSHQLRVLRKKGWVKSKKKGQTVFYSLDPVFKRKFLKLLSL